MENCNGRKRQYVTKNIISWLFFFFIEKRFVENRLKEDEDGPSIGVKNSYTFHVICIKSETIELKLGIAPKII